MAHVLHVGGVMDSLRAIEAREARNSVPTAQATVPEAEAKAKPVAATKPAAPVPTVKAE